MADHTPTALPPHLDPESPARHDEYISSVLSELIEDDAASRRSRFDLVPAVIAPYEAGLAVGRQRQKDEFANAIGFGPRR